MRIVLRKRKKKCVLVIVIIFMILALSSSILLVNYYAKKISPFIIDYASIEIKKLELVIINNSLKEISGDNITDELFNVRYNSKGEVILVDFDSAKSSLVLEKITKEIEKSLKEFENGNFLVLKDYYSESDYQKHKNGIVVEVPLGIVTQNSLFNNFGPKIPVHISFLKNVETGFSTDVTEYGINNAMLKLNINIKVNAVVILPIISDEIETEFTLPIAMKVIQGSIPGYYMDGFRTNSNVNQS